MSSPDFDVVIVGAGAAGLAALQELDRAGLDVLCVEARDRIGGRIMTIRDPLCPIPIELGAEFIHGRSPEIWDLIRSHRLVAYDCADHSVHLKDGKPVSRGDAWDQVDQVMTAMQAAAGRGDQTFATFLDQVPYSDEAKGLAASYVEGFNAARREMIGIVSLAEDMRAADEIEGHSSFRLLNGYDSVILALLDQVPDGGKKLRLNSVVDRIEWAPGAAGVQIRSGLSGKVEVLRSRRVIVTVPLGVLQADAGSLGSIRFEPDPVANVSAARRLKFGHVVRLVLRFREAFWQANPEIANTGFLLSDEPLFPTWWTPLAVHAPVITGWSAGPRADALLGQTRDVVLTQALNALCRITGVKREHVEGSLEAAYSHSWDADPFSRGAYSYVPAGEADARRQLAQPVSETLYFAGEAAEVSGHSATVHGAIASGRRAARECIGVEAHS